MVLISTVANHSATTMSPMEHSFLGVIRMKSTEESDTGANAFICVSSDVRFINLPSWGVAINETRLLTVIQFINQAFNRLNILSIMRL